MGLVFFADMAKREENELTFGGKGDFRIYFMIWSTIPQRHHVGDIYLRRRGYMLSRTSTQTDITPMGAEDVRLYGCRVERATLFLKWDQNQCVLVFIPSYPIVNLKIQT